MSWPCRHPSTRNPDLTGSGRGCSARRGSLGFPVLNHLRPSRLPRCGFILLQLGDASHEVVLTRIANFHCRGALGSTMEVAGDPTAKIADFHGI